MYEPHEIATIFPLIEGAELQGLSDDIRENGLQVPVVLYEGKILDGRNRYNACRIAGVKPQYEEFKGTPEEAITRVWSLNFERRHLSSSQRAACDAVRSKLMDSYAEVREAAKQRQVATQLAGKDASGKPKAKSSVPNGTSVSQLIGTPKTEPTRTSQFRAKAVGTNREYIDLADKLLEEQPELFKQVQNGKKALTQIRRENTLAAPKKKRSPRKFKPPAISAEARVQQRFVERHTEYIDACLREPQPVSLARISTLTHRKINNMVRNSLLQYWALVPWLNFIPTSGMKQNHKLVSPAKLLYTFKQNRYLRAICEDRIPRPKLSNAKAAADLKELHIALGNLRREIERLQKEAEAEDNNWNPTIVQKADLMNIIKVFKTTLDELTQ